MFQDDDSSDLLPACIYARVSTKRQAEHETSLEDQQAQLEAIAASNGFRITKTYIDAGKSGMNDRRPEFQQMIGDACSKQRPYKAVFVWNFSRFFRDEFEIEGYRRRLEKAGVELISATQNVGTGPYARMLRNLMTTNDAISSEINAAQVRTVMAANANGGFWNGSIPPLGYRTYIAARRGTKDKKKIEINPLESALVERIFDLYLMGDGVNGPMGIGRIVKYLNTRGIMNRNQVFSTSSVHAILRRETYIGRHYYNCRDSRSGEPRPRDEWITVEVPKIIPDDIFAEVQSRLTAHSPKVSAPRTHTSPVLLSGIAKCGQLGCTASMMLMTGKSGRYRYYCCADHRTKGGVNCSGNTVSMPMVDDAVMAVLEKRLFQPDRLNLLLQGMLDASNDAHAERKRRLTVLRKEESDVRGAVRALLKTVENGVLEPDDPDLKERMALHKARQASISEETAILERQLGTNTKRVTPEMVERFAAVMRKKLHDPADPLMRQHYVRAFVSEVEITRDKITVRGPRQAIEHAVAGDFEDETRVRSFVGGWRARQESNLWPQD